MDAEGAAIWKAGPSARVGVEPSDLVVNLLGASAPVNQAVFFEEFGRFFQACAFCGELGLWDGVRRAVSEVVYSGHQQMFAGFEQSVVDVACGVVRADGDFHLVKHMTRVDFVLEQEGGRACGCFPVEYGPVNGGRASVLGQQRTMQVHLSLIHI